MDKIRIYPNPANNGKFFVIIPDLFSDAQIQIYDLKGIIVYNGKLVNEENEINTQLAGGIYFVQIINRVESFVQKVIIDNN